MRGYDTYSSMTYHEPGMDDLHGSQLLGVHGPLLLLY
jgi:hypothetical protein